MYKGTKTTGRQIAIDWRSAGGIMLLAEQNEPKEEARVCG